MPMLHRKIILQEAHTVINYAPSSAVLLNSRPTWHILNAFIMFCNVKKISPLFFHVSGLNIAEQCRYTPLWAVYWCILYVMWNLPVVIQGRLWDISSVLCVMSCIGNNSVPTVMIYNIIKLFFKTALSILVISNHNSSRVLFDKTASVCSIWKINLYFSIRNGQPKEPALCQLYRHSSVPIPATLKSIGSK